MKKVIIAGFLLISTACLAQAQDNIWTLEECIDYAMENNLALKRARLGKDGNEVSLKQSKLDLLPDVNANGSYGFNWGRSIDPTTNLFITERINFTSARASAGVTVFSGWRQLNNIKQSELDVTAAEFDVKAAENTLSFNIAALYINVVFNKELTENASKQLDNTRQQLKRVKKQVEVGALPKSDQLDLEAQEATNELNLIQQQNTLDLSLLQLKQALQLPADTDFEVVVPESMKADINPQTVVEYSAEEIYDKATEILPEFKSARAQIQSAEVGVDLAKGALYPSINATAGLSTNYSDAFTQRFIPDGTFVPVLDDNNQIVTEPTAFQTLSGEPVVELDYQPGGSFESFGFVEQFEENLSRSLSFGLNVPIFNGWNNRANIQRAIITQEQAEINMLETRNNIRQDIETAYNDVVAAARALIASQRQVEAREEAYRMTNKRYELGATSFIDYQLSENQLFQARSDFLRAKYDYIYKTEILDFYLGNPIGL